MNRWAHAFKRLLVATGADRMLLPLTNRRPPHAFFSRLAPGNLHYRKPTLRRVEREGIHYELDLSDFMDWFVYYGIQVEPREPLLELCPAGGVALDVGTNSGEVLLKLAMKAGRDGRIIGFEPNPRTFRKCTRNLALNAFANVAVHNVGLGRAEGTLRLHSPSPSNSGGDRILAEGDGGADAIEIPVTTVDRFAASNALRRLDLIKIDVEGYEMNVLRGAEDTLRTLRPRLFVEVVDDFLRAQSSSASELVRFLEDRDYAVTHSETRRPVRSGDAFAGCHFDVVGIPIAAHPHAGTIG